MGYFTGDLSMSTKENKLFIEQLSETYHFDKKIKWKRISKSKHESGGSVRVFVNDINTMKITLLEDNKGNLTLLDFSKGIDFNFVSTKLGNKQELLACLFGISILSDMELSLKYGDYQNIDDYLDNNLEDQINESLYNMFKHIDYDYQKHVFLDNNNIPPQFTKDELNKFYQDKDWTFIIDKLNNISKNPDDINIYQLEYGFIASDVGQQITPEKTEVNYDGENYGLSLAEDNGLAYIVGYSGGDWEHPVTFFYFLNKENNQMESFFPKNNKYCYNLKTNEAYGNADDDEEDEYMESLDGKLADKAEASIKADFYNFLSQKFQ